MGGIDCLVTKLYQDEDIHSWSTEISRDKVLEQVKPGTFGLGPFEYFALAAAVFIVRVGVKRVDEIIGLSTARKRGELVLSLEREGLTREEAMRLVDDAVKSSSDPAWLSVWSKIIELVNSEDEIENHTN